ncbi:MAG: LysR family transcriptional regulator [Planctomycetes bacterium]|nr:LysR family transcriptional regulator [Planctomycetota bacterium]MCB9919564.1 LysR family transcriptional regulator [Planctomycetota bacterium]
MIDLNRLAGFHLVATSGGYAKAARAASYPISQPALHQQVRKLEREVGVTLLERVGKDTMRPTPAGQRLLEFVSPWLRDLPRIVESLRTGDYDGALSIHAESLLIRNLLPQWLRAVRKRRPNASIGLQELVHVDVDLLRSGVADVLIAHIPDIPSDIASQVIAKVYACLVVPREHRPKRGRPKLESLTDMPFLGYPSGTRQQTLQLQALLMHGITPSSMITLDTADTILGYVESGLGWSLVPSLDPQGPKGRRLTAYPWGSPRVTFDVVMAWRKDAPEHPLLDEWIATAPSL